MIAITDFGMGNLRSVAKAFEYLGHEAIVTRDAGKIASADRVVLPGDAAFGAAMDNLHKFGLVDVVLDFVRSGRPLLGICIGIQLLMDESEEQGSHEGLGIVPGKVLGFFQEQDRNDYTASLKIPHMGWNAIDIKQPAPILKDVPDGSMMYFVHSFYPAPEADVVAATTDHGIDFCSILWKNNVFATQFHPEKSGAVGLTILKNFAEAT